MPLQVLPQFIAPVAPDFHGPQIPDFGAILDRAKANRLSRQEQQQLMQLRSQLMAKNADEQAMAMADSTIVPQLQFAPNGVPNMGTTEAGTISEGSPAAVRAVPLVTLPSGRAYDASGLPSLRRQEDERKQQDLLERERNKVIEVSPGTTSGTIEDLKAGKGYTAPSKSAGLTFQKSGNDIVVLDESTGAEVRRITGGAEKDVQRTPQGLFIGTKGDPNSYELVPGTSPQSSMKPSERIQTFKVIKDVYDDSPSRIQFYGKGQQLGSDQLKTNLDSVLKKSKGDFTKLTASEKAPFVYAFNKLNDPTSATLLSEFSVIANRMGLLGRVEKFIGRQVDGSDITPEVAKDLYSVISEMHAGQKENLINDLVERKTELDELGKPLTSIGVPKKLADEVEARIASQEGGVIAPGGTREPSGTVSAPSTGQKIGRFVVTPK